MRRLMLTIGDTKCPLSCTYCFADFSDYKRPLSLSAIEQNLGILEDVDVIYPACDVDLFVLPRAVEYLKWLKKYGKSVSVSTKAALSSEMVSELSELAADYTDCGAVLKVGVSITCKRSISTFEPRAATYQQRLNNLAMLASAAIDTCVVLKPILADIPLDEYIELIADTSPFADLFLLGDHYLSPLARITRIRKLGRKVTKRIVRWAQGQPIWNVEIPFGYAEEIKRAIREHGALSFDSDLALMEHLVEKKLVSAIPQVSKL